MKRVYIALAAAGVVVILFAVFCPAIIVEVHSAAWRIVVGLLGCFSFVSGMYKAARARHRDMGI